MAVPAELIETEETDGNPAEKVQSKTAGCSTADHPRPVGFHPHLSDFRFGH